VAAFASFIHDPQKSDNYLSTLITAKGHRGQGLACLLYDYLENEKNAGVPAAATVSTRTWSENAAHIELLKKRGYQLTKTIKDDRITADGRTVDTVYFSKAISKKGKKILLISTGGTISQSHNELGVTVSTNAFKADTFASILERLKSKFQIAEINSMAVLNKDSSNMTMLDWSTIVQAIVDQYDNYDAFIVTHGTNTMGYTTAAASFAIGNLGKAVAFTGAQVSYSIPGSDSIINLENILRVITEKPQLVGVFMIFGSKIITGTRVKKRTEFDYDAFKTFGRGADIGQIGNSISFNENALNDHMRYLGTRATTKSGLDVRANFDANIMSLTEFPGLLAENIITLAKSGVKGFVFRATGAGDPNVAPENATYPNLRKAFKYLQDHQIPIVVTTQAPDGVASMNLNTPGILAKELGAIPAFDSSMETMVSKLAWLIGNHHNYAEIKRLMLTSLRGEICI
jgi:L-asparaginase